MSEERHADANDSLAVYEEQPEDLGIMRNADYDLRSEEKPEISRYRERRLLKITTYEMYECCCKRVIHKMSFSH